MSESNLLEIIKGLLHRETCSQRGFGTCTRCIESIRAAEISVSKVDMGPFAYGTKAEGEKRLINSQEVDSNGKPAEWFVEENDDFWELYFGFRDGLTHPNKIIKIPKIDNQYAVYFPEKKETEFILTALNNQAAIDRAWQQMTIEESTPKEPEQLWECQTSDKEEGRRHNQCPTCKRWFHDCGSCDNLYIPNTNYCSENCWKSAGSPTK